MSRGKSVRTAALQRMVAGGRTSACFAMEEGLTMEDSAGRMHNRTKDETESSGLADRAPRAGRLVRKASRVRASSADGERRRPPPHCPPCDHANHCFEEMVP